MDVAGERSAVHRPVNKVENNIGSWEDHAGVFIDGMRVLHNAEGTDALFLIVVRFAAHWQVNHHVLLFLCHRFHGSFCVASQAVGVSLTVGPIQHHCPGVGHTAGAGQWLEQVELGDQGEQRTKRRSLTRAKYQLVLISWWLTILSTLLNH